MVRARAHSRERAAPAHRRSCKLLPKLVDALAQLCYGIEYRCFVSFLIVREPIRTFSPKPGLVTHHKGLVDQVCSSDPGNPSKLAVVSHAQMDFAIAWGSPGRRLRTPPHPLRAMMANLCISLARIAHRTQRAGRRHSKSEGALRLLRTRREAYERERIDSNSTTSFRLSGGARRCANARWPHRCPRNGTACCMRRVVSITLRPTAGSEGQCGQGPMRR